jgi:hypothetical protein
VRFVRSALTVFAPEPALHARGRCSAASRQPFVPLPSWSASTSGGTRSWTRARCRRPWAAGPAAPWPPAPPWPSSSCGPDAARPVRPKPAPGAPHQPREPHQAHTLESRGVYRGGFGLNGASGQPWLPELSAKAGSSAVIRELPRRVPRQAHPSREADELTGRRGRGAVRRARPGSCRAARWRQLQRQPGDGHCAHPVAEREGCRAG